MKKVILEREPMDTVLLADVDSNKIYLVAHDNELYKLSNIDDRWMFCYLFASWGGHASVHAIMQDAITAAMSCGTVLEFDNFSEARDYIADWRKE